MKKMNSKGFTMIELLAVITIMGILTTIAVIAITITIMGLTNPALTAASAPATNSIR